MNSQKRNQVTLRISREMDEKLAAAAKKMGVSKNAYIVMILHRSLSESA